MTTSVNLGRTIRSPNRTKAFTLERKKSMTNLSFFVPSSLILTVHANRETTARPSFARTSSQEANTSVYPMLWILSNSGSTKILFSVMLV